MAGFLGMRGTGDWVTDERPKSWRQGMLYEYPNGKMPLTAITSMGKQQKETDPEFHWWTKSLAGQAGAITNIYTDALMSNAYTSGGSDGDTLYVKVAEVTAKEIRAGHQVLLRDSDHLDVDVNARVTSVILNGSSSMVTVKLMEDDDNGASTDLSDADRILIISNVNAEGAPMPDAISYSPTKYTNYSGIYRTPLSITRTARKTRLRTYDQYKEAKREAMELHGIEMEKSWFWSIPSEGTGSNGQPLRSTGGLRYFINQYASDNISNYALESDYSGKSWILGGEEWLDDKLEAIFRHGSSEKLGICGSGVIKAIQRLVKAHGQITLEPHQTDYGIAVATWVTGYGILHLKTHPLFSQETTNRDVMFVVDPEKMEYHYIDDTFFKKDDSEKRGGAHGYDATNEEFLTESGFALYDIEGFGMLYGFGDDNSA